MKTSKFVLSMVAMASIAVSGVTAAAETPQQGYLRDSDGGVVRTGSGQCWHTLDWAADMAIEGCGLVKVAEVIPTPIPPKPAPVLAQPAPVPEPPTAIVITLQSDTLFGFDQSIIRAEGKKQLDKDVIAKMKQYPQIQRVLVTGFTDRIGSDAYNLKLSQRRADAVKDYQVEQGIDPTRIETASKGESEPVVSCDVVKGKSNGSNNELVECLKPNRRVVVEIIVQDLAQN